MNSKQYKKHQAILPGAGIGVRLTSGKDRKSNIERALRDWKKQVKDAGIITALKNRMQYEKPSVTRRIAKKKARHIAKIQSEQN